MSALFLYISFTFTKFVPILIILMQHLRQEEGWNLHLVAVLLLIVIIHFAILKPMSEKVKVWEIQDVNTFIVFNFRYLRLLIVVGGLWYIWIIIHADYDNIFNTFMYVFASLFIGWISRNISFALKKEEGN